MINFIQIPRIYTGISEWLACMVILFPLLKGQGSKMKGFLAAGCLIVQVVMQIIAGHLPGFLWVPGIIINVVWMYITLNLLADLDWKSTIFQCCKAFAIAEFTNGFCWQIFYKAFHEQISRGEINHYPYMLLEFAFVFFIFFMVEIHLNRSERLNRIRNKEVFIAIFTIAIVFLFSNSGSRFLGNALYDENVIGFFYTRSLVNISGVFILYLQEKQRNEDFLKRELLSINHVFLTRYQQYVDYKEDSDYLSGIYHDLKHQIDTIKGEHDPVRKDQYLADMEKAIKKYELLVETGHPVLDTILTRKNQYCLEHGIKFSCFVDGKLLDFMETMDICSLFGNALDNAIESVEKLQSEDKKLIQLRVSEKQGFIIIKVKNYSDQDINVEEGLPETTKEDSRGHGYGLKSISHTVSRYDGTFTISFKDSWFCLNILLPIY